MSDVKEKISLLITESEKYIDKELHSKWEDKAASVLITSGEHTFASAVELLKRFKEEDDYTQIMLFLEKEEKENHISPEVLLFIIEEFCMRAEIFRVYYHTRKIPPMPNHFALSEYEKQQTIRNVVLRTVDCLNQKQKLGNIISDYSEKFALDFDLIIKPVLDIVASIHSDGVALKNAYYENMGLIANDNTANQMVKAID